MVAPGLGIGYRPVGAGDVSAPSRGGNRSRVLAGAMRRDGPQAFREVRVERPLLHAVGMIGQ